MLHLFLTIGIAAILYAKGEMAADWCRRFGRRLADERGEEVVVLAGQAIRGVALGVVLTALAQTLATGIALTAAGMPQAGLLTAVALILCLAQIGPILVVLPLLLILLGVIGGLLAFGVLGLFLGPVIRRHVHFAAALGC